MFDRAMRKNYKYKNAHLWRGVSAFAALDQFSDMEHGCVCRWFDHHRCRVKKFAAAAARPTDMLSQD